MLQPFTIQFLKNLKKNNNKPWFDANRKNYEIAKSDFIDFTEKLIAATATFNPATAHLIPKECIFRINRDVRFSKDKSPYKSNMAAYFNHKGKKGNGAGYYLHIEPGKNFAAGGIWMPEPAVLAQIRQEIDYDFEGLKKIINAATFKKKFTEGITGEALVRPPKGYDDTNPAIAFIKQKSFIVSAPFTDADVLHKNFIKSIAVTFKTMKPFVDFLNTAAS